MLGEKVVVLIQEAKKIRSFSQDMEMATHYKKYNYGYFDRLLGEVIKESASDEERKILRPWESGGLSDEV